MTRGLFAGEVKQLFIYLLANFTSFVIVSFCPLPIFLSSFHPLFSEL